MKRLRFLNKAHLVLSLLCVAQAVFNVWNEMWIYAVISIGFASLNFWFYLRTKRVLEGNTSY